MIRAARTLGRSSCVGTFVVAALLALVPLAAAAAQLPADTTPVRQPTHQIDGHLMLGTAKGLRPLADRIVTLHRVGPDSAGPLDSTRTRADGAYQFTYRPWGSSDAVYFVSASYDGIAYFSEPTRGQDASGDAAAITVFDTTSGPVHIRLAGHHVVVAAPEPDGTREIAEVFDLANDSSVTLVSPDGQKPVWVGHLPPGATDVKVNPSADIPPGAVSFRHDSVFLVAPLEPGMRQLSYDYSLGRKSFPLEIPLEQPTSVVEVLAEEPKARVSAAHLREVAPVQAGGRMFRRFLAEDVPGDAVLTIDVPSPSISRVTYIAILASVFGVAMLVALAVAFARRSQARARLVSPVLTNDGAPPSTSEALMREIAMLDARAEREPAWSEEERARYLATRDELKARLATALAEENREA